MAYVNGDRTRWNARWLFKEDHTTDLNYRRMITGGFWNNDPSYPFKPHIGYDYGSDIGERLTSYDDGTVIKVGGHSDYGKQVFIYHHKINRTSHYAHMDSIAVSEGQSVKAQQVIGTSGNTGKSSGPHLHFSWGIGKIYNTNKDNNWEDFEEYRYPSSPSKPNKPAPSNNVKVGHILALTKNQVAVYGYNDGKYKGVVEPMHFSGKLTYPILEVSKNGDIVIYSDTFGKVRVNKNDVGSIYKAKGIQLKGASTPVYDYNNGTHKGELTPDVFGGLDYKVVDVSKNGDLIIQTDSYGKVRINNRDIYNIYG